MKFGLAVASIGALYLSAVEAIKLTHKFEWVPPCEVKDKQCWENLGSDCDSDDDACHVKVLGLPDDELPNCQSEDDDCWNDFWNQLIQRYYAQSHKHKKMKTHKVHKYNQYYFGSGLGNFGSGFTGFG